VREKLGCYSGLYSSEAEVRTPTDVDELRAIFAEARDAGRRVTFRAAGHSFDGQSLGGDLVVSMLGMDSIEVLDDGRMKVGPGATWGAILAALKPLGLVPAVTVTTEHATAGGTLSGDCLSRFSPSFGKEGEWIDSFDLLTVGGELITCTAPGKDELPSTREERAFCGAIGGLGYLGAVVSITYRVMEAPGRGDELAVRTIVRKYDTFRDLAADLVPATEQAYLEESDPSDPEKLDAIWSALDTRGDGTKSALFFTSAFASTRTRLMRVPFISKLMWRFYVRFLFKDGDEYLDDLEGFSFFMDGNARAKRIGKKLGFKMQNAQQTFVVPSEPGTEGGWDRAADDLVEWLEFAHEYLLARDLTPTLNDVLFVPRDRPFLLSASNNKPGFAVSYAFETSDQDRLARAKQAFDELADVLWDKFQGRVYLVKNVFAKPQTLAAMYGDAAVEFFQLKSELDPQMLLRDEFLERTFPALLDSGGLDDQD
jgi:decaprenylphospho-beta-D-ribofuranose 2-oxidase